MAILALSLKNSLLGVRRKIPSYPYRLS